MTQNFKTKKIAIADIYSKLIGYLDNLHTYLRTNSVYEANEALKDLFFYLVDKQKFVDVDIFDMLISLKNDIQNDPLKKGWFKQVKFKNKPLLTNTCEVLKKVTTIKKQELDNYIKEV